ncbi:hypothetical protein, partial [Rhizobacter sp. OV335]|uniref:hypothetical protein n=1 Tax=Rhizobacter sp. OV335 TaxID=1500264 RepID=UPI00091B7153
LHAVRIDTRLHRATPVDHCDPCHGNCVVCAQAQSRAEKAPPGIVRVLFVRAVFLVALCFALVIGCTLFKQPKPSPELPRATAKVLT